MADLSTRAILVGALAATLGGALPLAAAGAGEMRVALGDIPGVESIQTLAALERARERGEELPPDPAELSKPPKATAPTKVVPAWMRPPEPTPGDAPRSDVNVEALFEKAFGASTGMADEQPGSDAGRQ